MGATAATSSAAAPQGTAASPAEKPAAPPPAEKPAAPSASVEKLAADTLKTTVLGNTFVAPAGWSVIVRGAATVLEAPEGDSHIALVDVRGEDADGAVALAWKSYGAETLKWPLKLTTDAPDKDGWSRIRNYEYETSPNEKRDVAAQTRYANGAWTVILFDVAQAVGEKRGSQIGVALGRLLPKGQQRESFAGKKAHALDSSRIARLTGFVEMARKVTRVPGVSIGLLQDGKIVFAGGFGERELGKPAKVEIGRAHV